MKIDSQIKKVEITFEVNDQFSVDTQMCKGKKSSFLAAGRTEGGGVKLVIRLDDTHLFNLKQKIEKHLFSPDKGLEIN